MKILVSIIGMISSGKSTLLASLNVGVNIINKYATSKEHNCPSRKNISLKQYIDCINGKYENNYFHQGIIYKFQSKFIDNWINQLKHCSDSNIIYIERHPQEVLIFCDALHEYGKLKNITLLTDQQYDLLKKKVIKVNNYLNKHFKQEFLYLKPPSFNVLYNRILNRSYRLNERKPEKNYPIEYLKILYTKYMSL